MLIFPAIDIIDNKAVRLLQGDYGKMTVYNDKPEDTAKDFAACGARYIHIVDLDGAKNGKVSNFDTVMKIKEASGCFCEIGGGIRSMEIAEKYLCSGIDRVILGTAALTDRDMLNEAICLYPDQIAVGVDIKDGCVAIKGWLEKTEINAFDFCKEMKDLGVQTLICTDISKDGAMKGTNLELYEKLCSIPGIQITASGGVSSMDDIKALKSMGVYAAIIGKAYYTGAIDLKEAVIEAEK